jgi:3-hydroxybutyryl-CoA dehydratase
MSYKETIQITDELVTKFADLTGDRNPIHMNNEYALTSVFKNRIAHGMLVASFISRIIAEKYPGEGSIYVTQSLQFIKPCYINDFLDYKITLVKQDGSKFFLKTEVFKNNDLILDGEALIINYKHENKK